jgi:hypothetical protein
MLGADLLRRESGKIQYPPEPIAPVHEVPSCRGSRLPRIEPAKDHREIRCEDVRKRVTHVTTRRRLGRFQWQVVPSRPAIEGSREFP